MWVGEVQVDDIVLRHDVVPTVTCNCKVEAVPCISEQSFVDTAALGDLIAFAHTSASARCILSHYHECKAARPATSALFILPDVPNASWQPLLKGMTKTEVRSRSDLTFTTSDASEGSLDDLPPKFVVMYDPPRAKPGVIPVNDLPEAVQLLHSHSVADAPDLTFVFEAKVAGVPATVLQDSGAGKSFIDADFAAAHNFHISPCSQEVELADGSRQAAKGQVKLKVKIGKSVTKCTLLVLPMSPGFNVILGTDWCAANGVVADYGWTDPDKGNHHQAHLFLRKGGHRLVPVLPAVPAQRSSKSESESDNVLISARKAARLLSMQPAGSRPAFLVMVRAKAEPSGTDADVPTEEHQAVLNNLLDRFEVVFEPPDASEVPPDLAPEAIPLQPDAVPPNKPAFRISLKERQVLEEHVKEQLAKGWLDVSTSAFGAPVLFVPKPDGTLRMCIDYRELNRITVKNKYPLPRIDDLMDNLSGASCFSSLDLTSGYHQLVLNEKDRQKTAFNTHFGKYEYKVLPMGLSNAPAVFQAAMNKVFGSLLNKCVCVYLDDILIFSKTPEEHLRHVEQVLTILRDNNLKAKRAKCEFFKPELKFLGHIVSAGGMRPDPAKVEAVTAWPTPVSVYEVRSFLGLANYFRKYIRAYSAIAAPLTALLKGLDSSDKTGKLLRWNRLPPAKVEAVKAQFAPHWTDECQVAFDALKAALVSAPVLKLPDLGEPFELVCDACECPPAVGSVLLQQGRPVSFFSRKLRGPELGYAATDIEMLSVIDALKEWRCYLEGAPFTIVTDHEPNTYLDKATNPHTVKRRGRWLAASCGFDYTWVYRPGRMNVADPISRAPHLFVAHCAAVALVHGLTAYRRERSQGSHKVARLSGLGGAPFTIKCCQVCACGTEPAATLPDRMLAAAVTRRDAGSVADSEHPTDLPLPPPLQTAARWRSPRRAALKGGSDTPAVEPGEKVRRKRKRVTFTDPEVVRTDVIPDLGADEQPEPEATAWAYPSTEEDDVSTYGFFRNNFFDRVLAGYKSTAKVSKQLAKSLPLHADAAGLLWTESKQLYIPAYDNLPKECFESVHSHPYAGHYGVMRTVKKAENVFYWPGMAKHIKGWIKSCDSCQRVKAVRQKPVGKLNPLQVPERRWESVSMDFVTDLPVTPQGNDSIWVVVDRLSKLTHLEPCKKTITAEGTAKMFERAVFRHHGIPRSVVSDRDVRFVSDFWRSINKRFGTKLYMSTKDHPQSDGQTENANQVMEDTLRHFVGPYQNDWEDLLPVMEFAMNNAWNSTIQNTPFMLTYGQHPDDPTTAQLRHRNPAVNLFVGKWSEQLARAKRHIHLAQERQKVAADRGRRDAPEYQPGDEVLLNAKYFKRPEGSSRKLLPRWVGPFKIVRAVGHHKLAYEIELPPVVKHMHPVFHVSALQPYRRDGNYQPPPLPELDADGELRRAVAFISATRYAGSRRQYRVHWEGARDHDTWEPARRLVDNKQQIADFWANKNMVNPDLEPQPDD